MSDLPATHERDPNGNDLNEIERRVAAVLGAVAEAGRIVDEGGLVDLGGVQEVVAHICDALQALPTAEARAFSPSIETLQRELDALGVKLEAQRRAAADGLKGADLRHRAVSAYGKPPR